MPESQEPPAPAPVAGPQEPTSSAPRPTWSDQLEKIGKHVLLGSIVVYVLGYMVAASHFTSAGVPAPELSHNIFVGAGLLFVGVTGLGILVWQTVMVLWRRSGNYWLNALVTTSLPYVASNVISVLMQRRGWPSPPWDLIYVLLVGLFFFSLRAMRAFLLNSFHVGIAMSSTILLVSLFSATLYPFVPQAFGGGSPTRLFIWNAGSPPPSFPKPISEFSCQPDPSRTTLCRIVSLVFSSSSQDYYSIEERQTKCEEPPLLKTFSWPRGFVVDRLVHNSHFCFIRLANSEAKQLPIPAL